MCWVISPQMTPTNAVSSRKPACDKQIRDRLVIRGLQIEEMSITGTQEVNEALLGSGAAAELNHYLLHCRQVTIVPLCRTLI